VNRDQAAERLTLMARYGVSFQRAGAFAIYLTLSVLFFGLPLLGHLGHRYVGGKADPLIQMWALAWWPHALFSGVPSMITPAVWAPGGYNLAWTTSIPGPSLALAPITRVFGPIVSYNILCLLSPALAAFSMFVLCQYLTDQFWPAMLGGYLFGFSQYVLAHLLGHIFLLLIFPIPLAIYLVLLRLSQRVNRTAFLAWLVILLLFEFLSSIELFATTVVFGAGALIMSGLIYRGAIAREIGYVAIEIGCAYLVTAVLATPYLFYVFAGGVPAPINPSSVYSNDLLAFVVPTRLLYVSRAFGQVVRRFVGAETAAYLGPGVWIILVLYIVACWPTQAGKILILSLAFIGLMSLGPVLLVDRVARGPAPWRVFSGLPLIDQALPGRFGMYFFLVAAVITSLYLSRPISFWSKLLLASLCLLSVIPNLPLFQLTVTHVRIPEFFRSGEYTRYLARNDNVLVLPFAEREDGLLWQAETKFYFQLAAARFTLPPAEAAGWPVLSTLYSGHEILDFPTQLTAFLSAHRVKAIIVNAQATGSWPRLLGEAGLVPLQTGGVLFYPVTEPMVARFRGTTAHEMAKREASVSFCDLLNAARQYLAAGFPLPALSPWHAQRLNFLTLPEEKLARPPTDPHWWRNLWLGPWDQSLVGIGIEGDYVSLEPLIEEYGADATDIYFPFPSKMAAGQKEGEGQLLITFTADGLRRAASQISGTGAAAGLSSCFPPQFQSLQSAGEADR
jgi:hypothetical protein